MEKWMDKKGDCTTMTPQERCRKIIQESGKNIPEDEVEGNIPYFVDSGDGCPWLNPTDETEERQFKTTWMGYFEQFHSEMIDLALANPPKHEGELEPMQSHRGFHTMDDYGFEGYIDSDGMYSRIIDDYMCEQCLKGEVCTDPMHKENHCSKCVEFKYEEYLKENQKQ